MLQINGNLGSHKTLIDSKLDLVYFDEEIEMITNMINELNTTKSDKGDQDKVTAELVRRKTIRLKAEAERNLNSVPPE